MGMVAIVAVISITKFGTYLIKQINHNKVTDSMVILMNNGVKQSVSLMDEELKTPGTPYQIDSEKFNQIQSNHDMVTNDLNECNSIGWNYTPRVQVMLNVSSKYFTLLALATVVSEEQKQRKQDFDSALADFNIAISQYNLQYK